MMRHWLLLIAISMLGCQAASAEMVGAPETPAEAKQRRAVAETKQKLADVTPHYRRLQENSERTVLIVRAEGQGPEAIGELIQSMDSLMHWFINKRGSQREWFVNLEWGTMAVGVQFLLTKQDSPPPLPSTADALFSRFKFSFGTDQALAGFASWCRAGGHVRAAQPCAQAIEQANRQRLKF